MNTPNKLTIARMIIVPFLVIFLLTGWGGEANRYISLTLFVVASVTDWFDGYLARKNNLVTNFGKFMDPLADKLLVSSALISLVQMGKISAWIVVIIIAREFTISILRAVAAAEGIVIAASWWGKAKTITQIIAIIAILLNNFPFRYINFPFDMIMMWISVLLTVISGVHYIIINKHVFKG